MAPLARFEAGVGEHPAQVDDHLSVDVLVVWRPQDLGLAAELDLDLAVGLLSCRSDGLQKRQHLAPLDVAAQRVAEDLLERDAMVVIEVRCHEASSSGLRRHRLPACARPKKVAGSSDVVLTTGTVRSWRAAGARGGCPAVRRT